MKRIVALFLLVSIGHAYEEKDDYRVVDVVNFSTLDLVDSRYSGFQIVDAPYYGNKTIREVTWSVCDDDDNCDYKRKAVESAPVVEITVANKNPYAPKYTYYNDSDLDYEIPGYKELTFYVKAEEFDEKELESVKYFTKRNWRPGAYIHRRNIVQRYFKTSEVLGERTVTLFEEQCTDLFVQDYGPVEDFCASPFLKRIPIGKEKVSYRTITLEKIQPYISKSMVAK